VDEPKTRLRHILRQSLMAFMAVMLLLGLSDLISQTIVLVSLGASVFIVFAQPCSTAARPRNILLGYAAGAASGLAGYYLLVVLLEGALPHVALTGLACALAAAMAIFLMALMRADHPPAAAMALGIVLGGVTGVYLLIALVCVLGLALMAWLMCRYLVNLF
jgi:CBS domain-containing membrane protein